MFRKRLLLMVFVISSLVSGCVSDVASAMFQSPSVSVTSITPKNMTNGQLAFDVGLQVHNPNAIPLPIDTISSDIALNGLSLLSASGTSQKAIPAGGNGEVTLSANLGASQIQQLVSTLRSPNIDYDLKGKVGVIGTNMVLPIQQKGRVNAVELATKLVRSQLGL